MSGLKLFTPNKDFIKCFSSLLDVCEVGMYVRFVRVMCMHVSVVEVCESVCLRV